jgi:anti-sigma B factor antagonist
MNVKVVAQDDSAVLVALEGEMDLYTAKKLKSFVEDYFQKDQPPLILDCANLTYIDSSGVSALLHTFSLSKKAKRPVWFANVQGSVRRVIELTSLLGFLPIVESVEDARARLVNA